MAKWLAWLTDRFQPTVPKETPLVLTDKARDQLCTALRVQSIASVQDLLNCLILSECVYKLHDLGPEEAVKTMKTLQDAFPPGLMTVQAVQCSLSHVHHRYLVASSPKAVYISFMGTKHAKDLLVDADFLHRPVWQATESSSAKPAAHRGFLARAKRVPVEQILTHARQTNRNLLLCGHSLGGAVATLCTLRVLQQASDAGEPQPLVKCVTFGSPAIGNPALAAAVTKRGWTECFQNVALPEDLVPRLLALNPDAAARGPELAIQPQALPPAKSGLQLPEDSAASSDPGLAGGPGQRSWQLPRRLWRNNPASTSGRDSNLLPPRADGSEEDGDTNRHASSGISHPPRRLGVRLPLQGWWGPPGAAASERAASSGEEDGAVEALVEGPAVVTGQVQEPGIWLRRLGQLQNLAASAAASSVGGVTSGVTSLLPTYAHFGRTLMWPPMPEAEDAVVGGDVRSRVLSGHRMPAYRRRALVNCCAIPGMPPPLPGSGGLHLSQDVLPPAQLDGATADLQPLPPPDSATSPQSWWSWRPAKPGADSSPAAELTLKLRVEGRDLRGLWQGRMLAFGATWCPVRVVGHAEAHDSSLPPQLPGPLARLAPRVQPPRKESLSVETLLPAALAAQVYRGQASGPMPPLELHLRSDFAEVAVPVRVRLPTVWLLGSSAAASRRLMAALGAAAGGGGSPPPLQPAEVVLDGSKWCDLLAAPAATPHMALAALGASLPGPATIPGPLQIVDVLLQGLRAWLVGPQLGLRDSASCSAIVLAVDRSQPPLPKLMTKLQNQAEKAGVKVVVAKLGGATNSAQTSDWPSSGSSVQLEEVFSQVQPQGLLSLRREVHRALTHGALSPQPPLSRL